MTTNYDPIAEQYQRSKQQPWRTCIEAYSLFDLVGDVRGQRVLDIACGEGFYSRQLKQRGAAVVQGVDLSEKMIDLARDQEARQLLGVEYRVADARQLQVDEPFDLAVAAYLLNYARDAAELTAMCAGIAQSLKPGGRFVTINSSPWLHFPTAPSYRQYEFETSATGAWEEGCPICWRFHLPGSVFEIENYYLSPETHEAAFLAAGFRQVRWQTPRLSPEGQHRAPADFWTPFLNHPPVTLIECVR